MPLLKGKSNIHANIRTEMNEGKPYKEALAIALQVAYGDQPEGNSLASIARKSRRRKKG